MTKRRRLLIIEGYARRWRVFRSETRSPDDDPGIPDEYVDDVCLWLWDHPQ